MRRMATTLFAAAMAGVHSALPMNFGFDDIKLTLDAPPRYRPSRMMFYRPGKPSPEKIEGRACTRRRRQLADEQLDFTASGQPDVKGRRRRINEALNA